MTCTLSTRSLSFVSRVDPRLIAVAKLAISLSTQDFGFTAEQSRTLAEERALMTRGFSHTIHSHHLINDGSLTWEATQSAVGFSGAIDAVPWNGSAFVWEWPLIYPVAEAFREASAQLAMPITWGGEWGKLLTDVKGGPISSHTGFDGPHFELGRN